VKKKYICPTDIEGKVAMAVTIISTCCISIYWWPRTNDYTTLETAGAIGGSVIAVATLTILSYFGTKRCSKNYPHELSTVPSRQDIYEDEIGADESDSSNDEYPLHNQPTNN
jgi:hypothetical protein